MLRPKPLALAVTNQPPRRALISRIGGRPKNRLYAIELARAFVADLERRTCRIQFTREYALPRGMQAKLLLKIAADSSP